MFGVKVNCPFDDVIPDITSVSVPGLFTVACNNEFEPSDTDPKSRLAGDIEKFASMPVPCSEYDVGDPLALWVNTRLSVLAPTTVGVNVISNTWLPPGSIVIGNVFGVKVNCPFDDVIPDITSVSVPGLFTVACNNEFEPITTLSEVKVWRCN